LGVIQPNCLRICKAAAYLARLEPSRALIANPKPSPTRPIH